MGKYELNQKLTLAKQRGFKFDHINKLTIKIYSNLSNKKYTLLFKTLHSNGSKTIF